MDIKKTCHECGSDNLCIDKFKGEITCRECGIVIDDKLIDFGKESREFDGASGPSKSRTGAPIINTIFDGGLSTQVGSQQDLSKLPKSEKYKYRRLAKWQKRMNTAIDRNLKTALSELTRITSFLKLSKTVEEEAARLYISLVQKNFTKGRSMEAIVVSTIYIACRLFDLPRPLNEFSEASGISKKEIGRTYIYIIRQLDIKMIPVNPVDYIARYISELHLSYRVQTRAVELINQIMANDKMASGKGPTGIAGASLYIAALELGERRTQREISDVAGITEVTIRNRYRNILQIIVKIK